MSSPSKSVFGSLRDKMTKKNRTPSSTPKSNPTPWGSIPASDAQQSLFPQPTDNLPPPPPYSPVAPNPPVSSRLGGDLNPSLSYTPPQTRPNRFIAATAEDPYAFLSSFDTIFLIDDSGSMAGQSWREVQQALRSIAPICTAHDANGIDVYFLNARNTSAATHDPAQGWHNITTPQQVESLFSRVYPGGATPTGTRINQILRPYLREYESAVARTGNPDECGVKPINMIVITDGVPTDDPEGVILSAARKLDALDAPSHQVGIQFFQVGCEPGAAEALRELDDGLSSRGGGRGGVRDMVDTVTWDYRHSRPELSADAILKVVLGAVVRRLDRRRLSREGGR
ncbi:hypothetical protein VTJ49DRAFT_593 [Mycothermus thermophilus]|uniref:VWFA domain-containing protein n=1 Tax=Humicola insolens TaxID=85995 RepID=A0ABR3VEX7_HUMIN